MFIKFVGRFLNIFRVLQILEKSQNNDLARSHICFDLDPMFHQEWVQLLGSELCALWPHPVTHNLFSKQDQI